VTIGRLYHRLLDALGFLAGALILCLMVGVSVDVLARYAFGRPVIWMFEVTEYALVYIPCLGLAWLARDRGHVAITSFAEALPPGPARALSVVTLAACAGVCAVIAGWGAVTVLERIERGTVLMQMLAIPEYLILWVIPFGFGLGAVEFARLAIADATGARRAED
jgi:TRAP-type C4-dicarboxylate transport system permease small subunit